MRLKLSTPFLSFVIALLTSAGGFLTAAAAQTATLGGGLDCNGWSPISPNASRAWPCADPRGALGSRFLDNGWYVGHDEPAVQFFSTKPGSGNNLAWRIRLPQRDPVPTQSGSSVATFELARGFVFGLALCDPRSNPFNPCTPNSDTNASLVLPTDAGSAALELFIFPPGYPPLTTQLSCDLTHWCAGLGINSLECDYYFNCNPNCTEPGNGSLLQDDGIPPGPPGPGAQTLASFTPNAHTLLMNPGDDLVIAIRDTPDGVLTLIIDLTTGREGFMVASPANGFQNTDYATCQTYPFSFHPEFSTASPGNGIPWASLYSNVSFFTEIGHFELGGTADSDADDSDCFSGPTVAGCIDYFSGGDLDFDGPPYQPDWPDGSKKHPSPLLIGSLTGRGIGPMSASPGGIVYSTPYTTMQFKTNVANADSNCNFTNGVGCVVPPNGAAFYPFYSQLGTRTGCLLTIGNDIPGRTTNDFGKDAQYGPYTFIAGFAFGNFGALIPNPCSP
jgi:hypothetical protein